MQVPLTDVFSDDAIVEWFSVFEELEVVEKMLDQALVFVVMAAGGVRGNEAVGKSPEGVIQGKRFGRGDIQVSGGDASLLQGGQERILVHGAATADVIEDGGGFHLGDPVGIDEVLC